MKIWEYLVRVCDSDTRIEAILYSEGRNGWELVQILEKKGTCFLYFKREENNEYN